MAMLSLIGFPAVGSHPIDMSLSYRYALEDQIFS